LNVAEGTTIRQVIIPQAVNDLETDEILTITNLGRMLLFPIKDLPQLGKGKGNKIINIPAAKAKSREEIVSHLIALPSGASVTLYAGKRKLGLKPSDLDNFRGERGRRGGLLPRGLQRVTEHIWRTSNGIFFISPFTKINHLAFFTTKRAIRTLLIPYDFLLALGTFHHSRLFGRHLDFLLMMVQLLRNVYSAAHSKVKGYLFRAGLPSFKVDKFNRKTIFMT